MSSNNEMQTDKANLSRLCWRKSRASLPLPLIAGVSQTLKAQNDNDRIPNFLNQSKAVA